MQYKPTTFHHRFQEYYCNPQYNNFSDDEVDERTVIADTILFVLSTLSTIQNTTAGIAGVVRKVAATTAGLHANQQSHICCPKNQFFNIFSISCRNSSTSSLNTTSFTVTEWVGRGIGAVTYPTKKPCNVCGRHSNGRERQPAPKWRHKAVWTCPSRYAPPPSTRSNWRRSDCKPSPLQGRRPVIQVRYCAYLNSLDSGRAALTQEAVKSPATF